MPNLISKWKMAYPPAGRKNGKWKFKTIFIFLFTLTVLLHTSYFILHNSLAETSLERAQQDYTFQFTKYRDAEEKYQVAKSTYETFKTTVAKNDAFEKTKSYLNQIENLYIAYLLLVKEHGNTFSFGAMEAEKDKVVKIIDSEIIYLQDYQKKIIATQTLEELPALATEMDQHIKQILESKVNKTLAVYEVAQVTSAYDRFIELSEVLEKMVLEKLQSGESSTFLSNWASEVKNVKVKAENSLAEAQKKLSQIGEETASLGELDNITLLTKETKNHLLKSKALFGEVITIL